MVEKIKISTNGQPVGPDARYYSFNDTTDIKPEFDSSLDQQPKPALESAVIPRGEYMLAPDSQARLETLYLEEAAILVNQLAIRCVENGDLTYPPQPSETLELASGLYDEHFAHEGFDRTKIIEMFAKALIKQVMLQHSLKAVASEVKKYADQVKNEASANQESNDYRLAA